MTWLRDGARWTQAGRGPADAYGLRQALVDKLARAGHVRSPAVAAALRAVPRELFVPDVPTEEVYRSSEAIVTKRIDGVGVSSASAPDVVAIMLEQLALEPGQRVLEIGAGTGYNAALMGAIVGEQGRVVTIDIDDDLVAGARAHLAAAGCTNVEVVRADGERGYAEGAPFDRIILTVAASDIAPSWREQLAPGGRLVLPLSLRGPQRAIAFEPRDGYLESVSVHCCSFIPLRGALAPPPSRFAVGPGGGIVVGFHDDGRGIDRERRAAAVYDLLSGPVRDLPSGLCVSVYELNDGLPLWLALREDDVCSLWADAAPHAARLVPALFGRPGRGQATLGLLDENGLALLAPRPSGGAPDEEPLAHELVVHVYGQGDELGERLRRQLAAWDAAGRPSDRGLRVRAYPAASPVDAQGAAAVIDRPHSRLVVDWVYEL
jgi:protein-L-isoaspartate(D-aspartate) O-methyltransferase